MKKSIILVITILIAIILVFYLPSLNSINNTESKTIGLLEEIASTNK